MNTTLNKVKAKHPCRDGFYKLIKGLGKTETDDEVLPLSKIVEINGIGDALWALRAIEGYDREIRLFTVWCASQVANNLIDERPLKAIEVAEAFARGQASEEERQYAWASAENGFGYLTSAKTPEEDEAWVSACSAVSFVTKTAAFSAARSFAFASPPSQKEKAFEAARNSQAQEFLRICAEIEAGRDPYPNKIFNST